MTLLTKQNWYATLETKNIAPKDPKIGINKTNGVDLRIKS